MKRTYLTVSMLLAVSCSNSQTTTSMDPLTNFHLALATTIQPNSSAIGTAQSGTVAPGLALNAHTAAVGSGGGAREAVEVWLSEQATDYQLYFFGEADEQSDSSQKAGALRNDGEGLPYKPLWQAYLADDPTRSLVDSSQVTFADSNTGADRPSRQKLTLAKGTLVPDKQVVVVLRVFPSKAVSIDFDSTDYLKEWQLSLEAAPLLTGDFLLSELTGVTFTSRHTDAVNDAGSAKAATASHVATFTMESSSGSLNLHFHPASGVQATATKLMAFKNFGYTDLPDSYPAQPPGNSQVAATSGSTSLTRWEGTDWPTTVALVTFGSQVEPGRGEFHITDRYGQQGTLRVVLHGQPDSGASP